MQIVLIGVPGAGKTTVGAALASRLNYSFIDTDQAIESQTNKTISEIFIQDGEQVFREVEKSVIAKALSGPRGVVSLGGGALLDQQTRDLVKAKTAVWLQTSLAQAVERVGMNKNRPLLLGNVRGQLSDLMSAREPLYIECAKYSVETNNLSVDEVVDKVIKVLGINQ